MYVIKRIYIYIFFIVVMTSKSLEHYILISYYFINDLNGILVIDLERHVAMFHSMLS